MAKSKVKALKQQRMFEAGAAGQLATLRMLLDENDQLVQCTDPDGNSILHVVAKNGHADALRLLLAYKAPVDQRGRNKITPLMYAAKYGHVEVCELLMDAGSDPNLQDSGKNTALHAAAMLGHQLICRLLIERGARIHLADEYDNVALHFAARNGHDAVLDTLLALGANLHQENHRRQTAFHQAVGAGQVATARKLLALGAHFYTPAPGAAAMTGALHSAALGENLAMCAMLVEAGISPSFLPEGAREDYLTPFQYAVENGKAKAVRYFVEICNEDPEQVTLNGRSMAQVADGRTEMVELLRSLKIERSVHAVFESGAPLQTKPGRGMSASLL